MNQMKYREPLMRLHVEGNDEWHVHGEYGYRHAHVNGMADHSHGVEGDRWFRVGEWFAWMGY